MSKKCIQCGTELDDNARFCDECGAQVENGVNRIPVNLGTQFVNQQPDAMKNSALGIASFVLGIIAICTFGLFVIPGALSIIMGVIAIRDPGAKHGLPIAGLLMSIVSFIILIILYLI